RRSSLPSNSDATGSRGSDHLGTGAPGAVVRRGASAALLNLYHSHRARLYPNRNQSWPKTVPAATNHRLYSSRYRHARSSLGDQPGAYCDWVGRQVGNMAMTMWMLPVTGVPLPLFSYSGSFVLMIMFGLGLVNSVWVNRNAVP